MLILSGFGETQKEIICSPYWLCQGCEPSAFSFPRFLTKPRCALHFVMELRQGQGLGCRGDPLSLQATALFICLAVCTSLEREFPGWAWSCWQKHLVTVEQGFEAGPGFSVHKAVAQSYHFPLNSEPLEIRMYSRATWKSSRAFSYC